MTSMFSFMLLYYCVAIDVKRLKLLLTFTLNITVFNATLSTPAFTLVLHVSATLDHHQVLLLLLL
jgi:hypothetical protein